MSLSAEVWLSGSIDTFVWDTIRQVGEIWFRHDTEEDEPVDLSDTEMVTE